MSIVRKLRNKYRDVSESSKTTLKIVIQRYVREIIKNKKVKGRERLNTTSY